MNVRIEKTIKTKTRKRGGWGRRREGESGSLMTKAIRIIKRYKQRRTQNTKREENKHTRRMRR